MFRLAHMAEGLEAQCSDLTYDRMRLSRALHFSTYHDQNSRTMCHAHCLRIDYYLMHQTVTRPLKSTISMYCPKRSRITRGSARDGASSMEYYCPPMYLFDQTLDLDL